MKPKLLTVRLDKVLGDHYHCTLIASGASAGKLCLRRDEFTELLAAHAPSPDNDDSSFEELARAVGLGNDCVREG